MSRVCSLTGVGPVLAVAAVLSGCGSARQASSASGIPRAAAGGSPDRPRPEIPSRGERSGAWSPQSPPGSARWRCMSKCFAANRVVIVAAGIGTRPPPTFSAGRIAGAGCYGDLVTLEPTGVVLLRPGSRHRLSSLFRAWGQPLSSHRLAGFSASAGGRVAVFVDGRPWHGAPADVPLSRHAEIVLEVAPYVPPHRPDGSARSSRTPRVSGSSAGAQETSECQA